MGPRCYLLNYFFSLLFKKKSNKVFQINFSHLKVFDKHSAVETQLIIDNLFFKVCLFSILEQVEKKVSMVTHFSVCIYVCIYRCVILELIELVATSVVGLPYSSH